MSGVTSYLSSCSFDLHRWEVVTVSVLLAVCRNINSRGCLQSGKSSFGIDENRDNIFFKWIHVVDAVKSCTVSVD